MSDFQRFESLFEQAESTSKREGKYFSQLSLDDQHLLGEFVTWLREEAGIKDSTSTSYKTYMAKAIVLPDAPVTSDQRSAIKKFKEFLAQR